MAKMTRTAAEHAHEAGSDGSYMSVGYLKALADKSDELLDYIDDETPLPDWVEAKIGQAANAINGVRDYFVYRDKDGEEAEDEGEMKLADQYTLLPSSITARFEAGKTADPTQHMSEEDAQKWKDMNDKHKDKFKKKAAWMEWRKYENDPVEVATERGTKVYPNLAAVQEDYPNLDPAKGGDGFHWAMRGEVKGQPAIRFETNQVYKTLSRDASKQAAGQTTTVKDFVAHILKENDEKEVAEILKELKQPDHGDYGEQFEHWSKADFAKAIDELGKHGKQAAAQLPEIDGWIKKTEPLFRKTPLLWELYQAVPGNHRIEDNPSEVQKLLERLRGLPFQQKILPVVKALHQIEDVGVWGEEAEKTFPSYRKEDDAAWDRYMDVSTKYDNISRVLYEYDRQVKRYRFSNLTKDKQAAAKVERIGKGKNGYICRYKGKTVEVMADTTYAAQQAAQAYFKAKNGSDISTMLAEKDGKQVTHDPAILASKQAATKTASTYLVDTTHRGEPHVDSFLDPILFCMIMSKVMGLKVKPANPEASLLDFSSPNSKAVSVGGILTSYAKLLEGAVAEHPEMFTPYARGAYKVNVAVASIYEQGMRAAALSLEAAWGPTAEEEGLTAEGCPDNLEGEDCDKWEANTDKYKDVVKDKHKQAGCEKLPEGGMRDNCEEKKAEGEKNAEKKEASSKTASRPLHEIAREIRRDWVKPYFGAVPYMQAMSGLDDITDSYGAEDARSIVAYFLGNASAWKGEVAKRIKAELNAMLKSGRRASEDAKGLEAAWGPTLAGDEDDEGKDADWEEGHVGPPESGPGGERSEEGSDTPDGSDNLAKRACGEQYGEDDEDDEAMLAEMLREGKFEEGKPADPTKDMSEEDAAEWKKQNEEHKDQFKSARVRLTANYMAHHYTTPDGKVYADTSFLTACGKLPGVSVEHMGFGEFYADTPKGRVDFDRMRGKDFPEQVGRSHQVYGENHAEKWLIAEMEKRNLSQDMTGTAVTASGKTADASLFKQIGPGDRVTIETPQGNQVSGRVVMRGPAGWVLNLGGPHGRPGIATESNVVKVVKAKTPGPRFARAKSAAPNTVQGWLEWED